MSLRAVSYGTATDTATSQAVFWEPPRIKKEWAAIDAPAWKYGDTVETALQAEIVANYPATVVDLTKPSYRFADGALWINAIARGRSVNTAQLNIEPETTSAYIYMTDGVTGYAASVAMKVVYADGAFPTAHLVQYYLTAAQLTTIFGSLPAAGAITGSVKLINTSYAAGFGNALEFTL
jgi:hypothetical protein